MPKRPKISKYPNLASELANSDIIDALKANRGVIKYAAQELKCSRDGLSKRINDDDELWEARTAAHDQFVDEVEKTYYDKMMETKDKVMMIFFLKCHGKTRGWVERQELTAADGEPLGQVVAPVRQVNAEEWAKENLKVVG